MSRLRRKLFASALVLGIVVLIGSGAALLRAQDGDPPAEPPAAGEPGSPFSLFPADEGAITDSELVEGDVPAATEAELAAGSMSLERNQATTAQSRASTDSLQEWAETDNGHAVHQAWSGYSQAMAAEAALRHAEYEAGLSGFSETGVVGP